MHLAKSLFTLLLFPLVAVAAHADDGILSWGGNPKLLSGKTTVRMVSENVGLNIKMKDYNGTVYVDCTFTLQNTGGPCDLRIGFPDKGEGAMETDYGWKQNDAIENGTKAPPYSALEDFRSWVDGKPVDTTIIPSKEKDFVASWHVKVVHFNAHQTRIVRDTYSQMLGGGATSAWFNKVTTIYLKETAYEMDTGASWKGNIGRATVTVNLPFAVSSATPIRSQQWAYDYLGWKKVKPGQVKVQGFARPVRHGRTLIFERTNFKPNKSSDIHIYWPIPDGRGFMGEDYAHGKF